VEFLRKYRDVKYFETLFELLAKQYEVAKIDESKSATLVQVLDAALPPEKKSRPKRTLVVVITLVLSFIASLFFIFLREKWLLVKKMKLNEVS
jgi:tyrosine-protein kinase Etk/Wzc